MDKRQEHNAESLPQPDLVDDTLKIAGKSTRPEDARQQEQARNDEVIPANDESPTRRRDERIKPRRQRGFKPHAQAHRRRDKALRLQSLSQLKKSHAEVSVINMVVPHLSMQVQQQEENPEEKQPAQGLAELYFPPNNGMQQQ